MDHEWDIQQSEKQESFRNILKSSANMYESLDYQFSRTNTQIKSGPDAFGELKILGVN